MEHFTHAKNLTETDILTIFALADRIEELLAMKHNKTGRAFLSHTLENYHYNSLFYAPSTRTSSSFQMAAILLGMRGISTNDAGSFSSAAKGEGVGATHETLRQMETDVIFLRHGTEGAADTAKNHSGDTSIINAGDGNHQHPTQALLDLYTIFKELNCNWKGFKIPPKKSLHIAFGGDLYYGRTVHSLAYLLAEYMHVRFSFVSKPSLALKGSMLRYLDGDNKTNSVIDYQVYHSKFDVNWEEVDGVYWTRPQTERHTKNITQIIHNYFIDYDWKQRDSCLDQWVLDKLNEKAIIMHPQPYNRELSREARRDPRSRLNQQVRNGLLIRSALLCHMFGVELSHLT